jgi:hypothetical protein
MSGGWCLSVLAQWKQNTVAKNSENKALYDAVCSSQSQAETPPKNEAAGPSPPQNKFTKTKAARLAPRG